MPSWGSGRQERVTDLMPYLPFSSDLAPFESYDCMTQIPSISLDPLSGSQTLELMFTVLVVVMIIADPISATRVRHLSGL
jgi:hypothetical protein